MANLQQFQTYDQQTAELQRRQRMAQLLQEQAMQPLESQVAPGGMVVPTSPLLGLSKMLQAYMGGKAQQNIEKQRGEMDQRSRTEAQDFLKTITQGQQQPMSPDAALAASLSAAPTEAQRVPLGGAERQQALLQASMSGNPRMAAMAQLLSQMKPERVLQLDKIDPAKFTPQSLAAAMQADNPTMLVPVQKPENQPAAIDEYNFAKSQGYKGNFTDWKQEMARAGATNVTTSYGAPVSGVDAQGNPVFFQPSKEGGKPAIIPGVRPETKPLNEGQANAAGYAKRLEMANAAITGSPFKPTLGSQLKAAVPFSNAFLSDAQQQLEQAEREFITAQLRRESGASISPTEFETARKQYFPQPGDSPAVLEQKARSRALAVQNMQGAAGTGAASGGIPAGAVRRIK